MHKTLKILALKQDDTLNSLVIEALKQFIENDELMNLKAEALRKRLSWPKIIEIINKNPKIHQTNRHSLETLTQLIAEICFFWALAA